MQNIVPLFFKKLAIFLDFSLEKKNYDKFFGMVVVEISLVYNLDSLSLPRSMLFELNCLPALKFHVAPMRTRNELPNCFVDI